MYALTYAMHNVQHTIFSTQHAQVCKADTPCLSIEPPPLAYPLPHVAAAPYRCADGLSRSYNQKDTHFCVAQVCVVPHISLDTCPDGLAGKQFRCRDGSLRASFANTSWYLCVRSRVSVMAQAPHASRARPGVSSRPTTSQSRAPTTCS